MAYGYGAGMLPTASAVVSDIIEVSNKSNNKTSQSEVKVNLIKFDDIKSRFYIRMIVKDKAGNLGKITSILGKHKINIDKVIQNNKNEMTTIPVIFLTKNTEMKIINKALKSIKKNKLIEGDPLLIPVEDL